MEREIVELRRRLATSEHPESQPETRESREMNPSSAEVYYDAHSPPGSSRAQSMSVSVDHQPSPLRRSTIPGDSPSSHGVGAWVLEDITLSKPRVDRLFDQ